MAGKGKSQGEIRKMVYASLIAALTAAGAWVTVPIGIIPLTLQTFFVILSGAVLGPYYGALSMIVYVLMGLIGLPVFSRGQSGFGTLLGPTGGYLIGFVLCAIVTGVIIRLKKKPGFIWFALAMTAGTLTIYACGVAGLMLVSRLPLEGALIAGVLPFVPGDIIKVIIASLVAERVLKER